MLGSVLSLMVVGGGGRRWELLGDSGIQGDWRAEIGGAWGAGGERVREVWGGERIRAWGLVFQSFSCSLSFGLGWIIS